MSVKIRLKRLGKIRTPHYRVVVADSRTKRDGRVIEEIGQYHPTEDPSIIQINSERAQYWLGVGAQPTEQVLALLKLTGDWGTFKGEKGAKNTVKIGEPKAEFKADDKKKPVLQPKSEKPTKVEEAAKEEAAAEDTSEAVAEAAVESATEEVVAEATEAVEAANEEAESAVAEVTEAAEEAPAEEAPAEDAKAE